MADGEPRWLVSEIDPGCGCCSYVPIRSFRTEREAKIWVAQSLRPSDYDIEEW